MKLLLDTHALLWWLSDDDALGPPARAMIAEPGNEVLVSVVSLWEILVKLRVGKLQADIADILAAVEADGFRRLDILPAHLFTLAGLARHHRDPFDHLLIAQAITEEAVFLSEDEHAPSYGTKLVRCSATT